MYVCLSVRMCVRLFLVYLWKMTLIALWVFYRNCTKCDIFKKKSANFFVCSYLGKVNMAYQLAIINLIVIFEANIPTFSTYSWENQKNVSDSMRTQIFVCIRKFLSFRFDDFCCCCCGFALFYFHLVWLVFGFRFSMPLKFYFNLPHSIDLYHANSDSTLTLLS